MRKNLLIFLALLTALTLSAGTVFVGAATLSPWAQKKANLFSNEVQTTFTPSWLTQSSDSQYGCTSGKYIKNSWCKVVEGNRTDYKISSNYYRPSKTWVLTSAKLSDSPFYTATMSYGWGYQ